MGFQKIENYQRPTWPEGPIPQQLHLDFHVTEMEKARAELRPGCWLVSLEFLAEELKPTAQLKNVEAKPVWLYRAPFK